MKFTRSPHPFPRDPVYKHLNVRMHWVLLWTNRHQEPRPQQGRLTRSAWLPMTGVQIAPMPRAGETDHCPDSWPVGGISGQQLE